MKNSILNLGKVLNKAAQQEINGGRVFYCYSNPSCPAYEEVNCIYIAGVCSYIG